MNKGVELPEGVGECWVEEGKKEKKNGDKCNSIINTIQFLKEDFAKVFKNVWPRFGTWLEKQIKKSTCFKEMGVINYQILLRDLKQISSFPL